MCFSILFPDSIVKAIFPALYLFYFFLVENDNSDVAPACGYCSSVLSF